MTPIFGWGQSFHTGEDSHGNTQSLQKESSQESHQTNVTFTGPYQVPQGEEILMGVQVAITLDDQLKPDYVVSTVAAVSFLVADEECIVWIGNAHGGGKAFEVNGLKRCLEVIRENGSATPTGLNESYAEVSPPGLKSVVNSAFNAAAVIAEEGKVGIWYGPLFQPHKGSTLTPHVKRAVEKYLETTQKAA